MVLRSQPVSRSAWVSAVSTPRRWSVGAGSVPSPGTPTNRLPPITICCRSPAAPDRRERGQVQQVAARRTGSFENDPVGQVGPPIGSEDQDVDAGPAAQHVDASTAFDPVIAVIADEQVVAVGGVSKRVEPIRTAVEQDDEPVVVRGTVQRFLPICIENIHRYYSW